MMRNRWFWIAFVLLAVTAAGFSARLFPVAFPVLNLDIRMSRSDAITAAKEIAARDGLVPNDAISAARFEHDGSVQNYVELEAGGAAAFAAMVRGPLYAPYHWAVRLFKPGEVTEATVRFRPDGIPWGFSKKVAEAFVPADPHGLSLEEAEARALAEATARRNWRVDLSPYRALEATKKRQVNGRIDHEFVYERTDAQIGAAKYRLRLRVSGDELTEVSPYVHIPEAFERRYAEMRSANNILAGAAGVAAGLLYGLGGCVVAVVWLLRRRWLVWKPALGLALVVAGLGACAHWADWPAAIFNMDTAQPASAFWIRHIAVGGLQVLLGGALLALVLMSAESLSRRAFPMHPQLWRVCAPMAAASLEMRGRVLGGYLFVPLELAFVVLFYLATNRWLGWWQPSEALTDPNVLASSVPALGPIANALQAGVMEECLFRAVPLSLAVLIGNRFGVTRLALGATVVLQALIFSAAHASYPGFPAYSRLAELMLPAIVWALIFLRFGLVPTMILHAVFDLVLMSLPLFLIDADGAFGQRAMVVVFGLLPAAWVAWHGMKAGTARILPDEFRNGAWFATGPLAPAAAVREHAVERGWTGWLRWAVPVLAATGLVAWWSATPFKVDAPATLPVRAVAEARAEEALAAEGVRLGPEWRRVSKVQLGSEVQDGDVTMFVWRDGGPERYADLMGRYVLPPVWSVRYVRFDGPVEERAEEWRFLVAGDGSVARFWHTLPEARAGARLGRDEAQALAMREVRRRLGENPDALRVVDVKEANRPARTDWTFTFADPAIATAPGGEARLAIDIAGDQVVGSRRGVFVPEAWKRAERERKSLQTPLMIACGLVLVVLVLGAGILAIRLWARHQCDSRALIGVGVICLAADATAWANGWSAFLWGLSSKEPLLNQIGLSLGGNLLAWLFQALAIGLLFGLGSGLVAENSSGARGVARPWLQGIMLGCAMAGVEALTSLIAQRTGPLMPQFPFHAAAMPWLATLTTAVPHLLTSTATTLFAIHALGRVSDHWRRTGRVAGIGVAACIAAAIAAMAEDMQWSAGVAELAGELPALLLLVTMLRFEVRMVPAYVAVNIMLNQFALALRDGSADAVINGTLAVVTVAVVAWLATAYLERSLGRRRSAGDVSAD
jgi:hypothetical protein